MPNGSDKVYIGQRPGDDEIGDCRIWVERRGKAYPLKHVVVHSPTGFEWGYAGSGPADSALSILADYLGEAPKVAQGRGGNSLAYALHQEFKWKFIATALHAGFRITSEQIAAWLKEREALVEQKRKGNDGDDSGGL